MNNATQIQTLTIDGNFFSGALVTEHGSEMSFSGLVTSGRQVLTVHRANGTKLDGRTKYARRIANAVSVERCMRILGLA